jgi:hypothetical protein
MKWNEYHVEIVKPKMHLIERYKIVLTDYPDENFFLKEPEQSSDKQIIARQR